MVGNNIISQMTKKITSFHRWDLHSVLWENPSRVHSMLHECGGSQNMKEYKIYLFSLFLFLFYLIETAVLLHHLLLDISY